MIDKNCPERILMNNVDVGIYCPISKGFCNRSCPGYDWIHAKCNAYFITGKRHGED